MANDFFFADLNGQSYYKIYKRVCNLDKSVTSAEERLRNVKKLVNNNSYLVKYFSDYFDPKLTHMNHISTGNNICHLVEMINNYLLMSDEVKAKNRQNKTYYIDSNHLNRTFDESDSINEKIGKNNVMVMKFNNTNYKKNKQIKIKKNDLDYSYCGRVLADLQAGINEATYKLRHHLGNTYQLSNMKHELHEDQIKAKTLLNGIFDLNNFNADSSSDDYYATLSEPHVVKSMLRMPHCRAIKKNVTQLLWLDLRDLLKHIIFSKSEHYVLRLYSLGYQFNEIGDKYRHNDGSLHPVSKQYIFKLINKLCAKIAHQNHVNIVNNLKKRYCINTN